jgi:hypothetical protein
VPADDVRRLRGIEGSPPPRGLALWSDGGQPGVPGAIPAEDRPRHNEHRAVGCVVEREAAERDQARTASAHLVIDLGAVDELAQPFLSVGEPVRSGRKRDPRGLAPSDQASALPNPCQGLGDRNLAGEALARIGDGHASHQQTF